MLLKLLVYSRFIIFFGGICVNEMQKKNRGGNPLRFRVIIILL